VEPSRTKDLTDIELPIDMASKILAFDPNDPNPRIDTVEAKRARFNIDAWWPT
jgi:hypothetical protein